MVPAPTNHLTDAHATSPFGGRHEDRLYFSAYCEVVVPGINQKLWPGTGSQNVILRRIKAAKDDGWKQCIESSSRENAPWRDPRGEETYKYHRN